MDVTCPQCEQMLLIVTFPTAEATRAAAAAGNTKAQREFERVETHDS